jgi:hypothetical protein
MTIGDPVEVFAHGAWRSGKIVGANQPDAQLSEYKTYDVQILPGHGPSGPAFVQGETIRQVSIAHGNMRKPA